MYVFNLTMFFNGHYTLNPQYIIERMCIKGTLQFDFGFLIVNRETYLGSKNMLKELMTLPNVKWFILSVCIAKYNAFLINGMLWGLKIYFNRFVNSYCITLLSLHAYISEWPNMCLPLVVYLGVNIRKISGTLFKQQWLYWDTIIVGKIR